MSNTNSDPTRELTRQPRDANAADAQRRARFANREVAVKSPEENAAILAHNLGVPIEITRRIIALESTVYMLDQLVGGLTARVAKLESKT